MRDHRYAPGVEHIVEWVHTNFPDCEGIKLMHEGLYALKTIKTSESKRVKIKVLSWKTGAPEMIMITVNGGTPLILLEWSDIKAAKKCLITRIYFYKEDFQV